jgi:ubiquinone/menaquinone biosynthesis C-methylase UbiE
MNTQQEESAMTATAQMEQVKEKHRAIWDSGDYGDVARRLVAEIGEVVVDRAGVGPGMDVLDVACGTGNATIPAAHARANRVVGLDLAPTLIAQARERADAAGVDVELLVGDAGDLPFEDGEFDRVISAIGIQFAPWHEATAGELVRVCRPGGLIVLANWTPEGFIGQFFKVLSGYMPPLPDFASPPPKWGSEDHVRELMGDHTELRFDRHTVTFEHDTAASFIDYMADAYGPLLAAREATEADGRWDDLRSDLIAVTDEMNDDPAGLAVPSEYVVVNARRTA